MDHVLKAIQQMEERMNGKIESLEFNMDSKFTKLEGKIELVTTQLDRMEDTLNIVAQTASDDTKSILKRIDANTSSSKQDVDYLAKQVGKHEMYFNRFNKS